MTFFGDKKTKLFFLGLLVLVIFLIFFRLDRHDLLSDDGHYAFRAFGYFDFMDSDRQTTPVQWFGQRPFWSFFSFHDHPPLYFLIQNTFFKILGESVFISRLTSALAGVGIFLLVYIVAKYLSSARTALFSVFALACNSYFFWMARIGLIEALLTFFVVLGFYFFLKALDEEKNYLWCGLFFGLAFLTKYTVLFVMPALLLFLLIWKRGVFLHKRFYGGVLVFVLISFPVFFYNLNMYFARGHFDVQFSDIFGQIHKDWPILASRVDLGLNFHFLEVIKVLVEGMSWFYFVIFLFAFLFLALAAWRKNKSHYYTFHLVLVFLFLAFSFIGGSSLWQGIFTPFIALVIGLAFSETVFGEHSQNFVKIISALVLSAVATVGFFYTMNTNHLNDPLFGKNWYSDFRVENYGYNQLDRVVSGWLANKNSPEYSQTLTQYWYYRNHISQEEYKKLTKSYNRNSDTFNKIIVIDKNTDWFPVMWAIVRHRFYKGHLIMFSDDFLKVMASDLDRKALEDLGYQDLIFIESSPQVRKASGFDFDESELIKIFQDRGTLEKTVFDNNHNEAFYIYRMDGMKI